MDPRSGHRNSPLLARWLVDGRVRKDEDMREKRWTQRWLSVKVYSRLLLLGLVSVACSRVSGPFGLAGDGAGNLYVADSIARTIHKIELTTGAVTTLAGTAGMSGETDGTGSAARFSFPEGVVADGTGNLYVADNTTIRKIVLATDVVTTLAGTAGLRGSADGTGASARFDGPTGMAVDSAGNLYVVGGFNPAIRKIVLATGEVTTVAGSCTRGEADGIGAAAQFLSLSALALDGAGNLYVTDSGNYTIRKIALATGAVTTLAGSAGKMGSADGIGAAARFSYPSGVAADGAGNLYVVDSGNSTIRKVVLATGAVTTLAGSAGNSGRTDDVGAAARFEYPDSATTDGAGNLYVGDNGAIRKVVLATGTVTTLAGTVGMFGNI